MKRRRGPAIAATLVAVLAGQACGSRDRGASGSSVSGATAQGGANVAACPPGDTPGSLDCTRAGATMASAKDGGGVGEEPAACCVAGRCQTLAASECGDSGGHFFPARECSEYLCIAIAQTGDRDHDGESDLDELGAGKNPDDPTDGPDIDGDGVANGVDDDVDGDGVPNGDDPDVDGDGVPNGLDFDVDGDGLENRIDIDIDGDGLENPEDPDMDGDGFDNAADDDEDGDGDKKDDEDAGGKARHARRLLGDPDDDHPRTLPVTPNDFDGDGLTNEEDKDDDDDGIPDDADSDDDNDSIIDSLDPDDDNDNTPDSFDDARSSDN